MCVRSGGLYLTRGIWTERLQFATFPNTLNGMKKRCFFFCFKKCFSCEYLWMCFKRHFCHWPEAETRVTRQSHEFLQQTTPVLGHQHMNQQNRYTEANWDNLNQNKFRLSILQKSRPPCTFNFVCISLCATNTPTDVFWSQEDSSKHSILLGWASPNMSLIDIRPSAK